jgi:hypothetical protein
MYQSLISLQDLFYDFVKEKCCLGTGDWYQWERGGSAERAWEGEYGAYIFQLHTYTCM